MIEPLIRTIEIPCTPQMAFEVFLDDMSSRWPLDLRTVELTPSKHPCDLTADGPAELGIVLV